MTRDAFALRRACGSYRLELGRADHTNHVFAMHTHECFVIEVVDEGVDEFVCNGESHRAEAGDIVIIAPGAPHTGRPQRHRPLRYRSFYPSQAYAAALPESVWQRATPGAGARIVRSPRAAALIRELHDHLWSGGDGSDGADALCSVLNGVDRCASPSHDVPVHPAAETARNFLNERYADRVTLGDLSRVSGLSPFHLQRVFRRATGMTPQEYLTNRRVHAARFSIRRGRPLGDIAIAAGFCDQSHLTRVFKRHVGVTPARYARAHGQ